jgi:hypothetical protein
MTRRAPVRTRSFQKLFKQRIYLRICGLEGSPGVCAVQKDSVKIGSQNANDLAPVPFAAICF